jgi:hypothetical protein
MEKDIKISFCCIVFNGDFVLKQLIESIYPFAHKIIFVDGVVDYWAKQGFVGSNDETINIIKNHPDPENKIKLLEKNVAKEKTELCRLFMPYVPSDTDYLWSIDSDEIFKRKDIEKIIEYLKEQQPTSVGFQSNTFFGGFDHILGGFERDHSFKRLLKYDHGCTYVDHRPPTLSVQGNKHISGKQLFDATGVEMYHYSYVSPYQVYDKIEYYEAAVISKGKCIPNYFEDVWLRWVEKPEDRPLIEDKWKGVHEFVPSVRGECRTMPFTGEHPEPIKRDLEILKERFRDQLCS